MIKINADEIKALAEQLGEEGETYRRSLVLQMWRAMRIIEAAVKQNVRSRSGLKVRSGTLLNSIMTQVEVYSKVIIGRVGPSGVPYSGVHEFGHDFKARKVEPRLSKVLAWRVGGQSFFSKGHDMPAFRVPARPYLEPAMVENRDLIMEKFGIFLQDSFFKSGG